MKFLTSSGIASGLVPALPWLWPGPESVGIVGLTNKGAVGLGKFLYRRPETAGKRGKDGFVDKPLLGRVIGIIINRDQVIEGFNQFGFRLGGVEVGRCRRCGRPLLPGFLLLLSGAALRRSLYGSRFRDGNDGSGGRVATLKSKPTGFDNCMNQASIPNITTMKRCSRPTFTPAALQHAWPLRII